MESNDSIFSEIKGEETEAPYLQRVAANIIDFLIEIIIIVTLSFLISKIFPGFLSSSAYAVYILVFTVMFLYRFLSVMVFQKTIGMIALRLKYLNADLKPLSVKEKLLAVAPIRTAIIKIYKEQ